MLQSLFFLYFEKDCPQATLFGAAANASYRGLWFDPRLGNCKQAGDLAADAAGVIPLPEFPSGLKASQTDWGLKLKRTDG